MCETLAITGFPAIAHLVGQKSTLEGHRRDIGEISKRNGYLILLRLPIFAVPTAPLDPHFRNREIGGTLARDIGKIARPENLGTLANQRFYPYGRGKHEVDFELYRLSCTCRHIEEV